MKRGILLITLSLVVSLAVEWPVMAQAQMLTLEQAIDIAQDRSTYVGVSREQLRQSRQGILSNYGRFLPNASISAYAGHSYIGPTSSVAIDAQGRLIQQEGFDYESYSFSINSSMQLFDWGANVKYLNNAKRNAEAAEHDLQYQKDVVTARVIREYYNLVRTTNLTRVQEESVAAAERNLEQVEAFFRIGSNTKADVLQAKVRLGNTQLELIKARNNQEVARATLASTLNLGVDETFDVDPVITITERLLNFEEETEYMLAHRSDLLASRKRVSASEDGLTAARNSRWPTLAASLGYGWNDRTYPENSNFFKNEYAWNIGVSMNFNVFDRFQTRSNIIAAEASARIAEYNLQQAKLNAILELKTLYLVMTEANERIRVSGETVNQAEENLRLAEERYRVGAGTILETIEAGVQLTSAQSSLIQAQIDFLIAKADMRRAAGRRVVGD